MYETHPNKKPVPLTLAISCVQEPRSDSSISRQLNESLYYNVPGEPGSGKSFAALLMNQVLPAFRLMEDHLVPDNSRVMLFLPDGAPDIYGPADEGEMNALASLHMRQREDLRWAWENMETIYGNALGHFASRVDFAIGNFGSLPAFTGENIRKVGDPCTRPYRWCQGSGLIFMSLAVVTADKVDVLSQANALNWEHRIIDAYKRTKRRIGCFSVERPVNGTDWILFSSDPIPTEVDELQVRATCRIDEGEDAISNTITRIENALAANCSVILPVDDAKRLIAETEIRLSDYALT